MSGLGTGASANMKSKSIWLSLLALNIKLSDCLAINELKYKFDNLNLPSIPKINDKRDFLDVDISSDVVPSVATILNLPETMVNFKFYFPNFYKLLSPRTIFFLILLIINQNYIGVRLKRINWMIKNKEKA